MKFYCCQKGGHGSQLMPVIIWGGSLMRACTESFGNVFGALNLGNIKVGQNFVLPKNGSWAPVDACNFLEVGSLIRACTGSFGNMFGGVNLRNNKVGQFFVVRKGGHGP